MIVELLAAMRPDEQNLPLLVHVFGAMILVGGVLTTASALGLARGDHRILRLGYYSLLAVALPGFILMRVGAEWIASRQGWDDVPDELLPAWFELGYLVADVGAVLLLAALIAGGVGVRRLRAGGGTGLLKATLVLTVVLLAAYVVAVWAMSAKPA